MFRMIYMGVFGQPEIEAGGHTQPPEVTTYSKVP